MPEVNPFLSILIHVLVLFVLFINIFSTYHCIHVLGREVLGSQ